MDGLTEKLYSVAQKTYEQRKEQLSPEILSQIEKYVILSTIDEKWMDHLDAMDNLRDGIWLRGDKQTVLSEYKKESFAMFEDLLRNIESNIATRFFRVQPVNPQDLLVSRPKKTIEHKDDINESLSKEVQDATIPSSEPTATIGDTGALAAMLKNAKAPHLPKPGVKKEKIGRNDLCPCGSGLKFKKCGLINAPEHRG